MTDTVTYIVDLNDMLFGDDLLVISRRDTLEHGLDVEPAPDSPYPAEGHFVTVYSGDEQMTWQAQVVKGLPHDQFAVQPDWATGRPFMESPDVRKARHEASDRLSLAGLAPDEVLRALLRTPRS